MKYNLKHIIFIFITVYASGNVAAQNKINWANKVRISGNPLSLSAIEDIIQKAKDSYVLGIETDNDITGRYDSFLNPADKLREIKLMADKAHEIGNYSFVYIAGLECITPNADNREHTFLKDHPDWVQRNINGDPAVFGSEDAFWITEGDEDVWITPYAAEWRKIYMEHVRKIAATGIDGIYVDIPYWMTHFEGWENTWASFDDYTVKAFKKQTGLDAKKDIQLGNYDDPGFIEWIKFRIRTLTDFMKEIDENVKSVNPNCLTIAEVYPGLGEEAVRVGADVYQMYEVVDVIAHEYSEGEYMASDREPVDWYNYMIGMHTFRAFAGEKPSWMLSYSWDGNEEVEIQAAMNNLFVSQIFSGTNVWDVHGHVMSGSNDFETRKKNYKWIADHEQTFYSPRKPVKPVGIYFSPNTRDLFAESFIESYKGMMNILVQSHTEFQVLTPRTLNKFEGKAVILPDVKCIDENEIEALKNLITSGKKIISTGETGKYNSLKREYENNPVKSLLSFDGEKGNGLFISQCPGKEYYKEVTENLNSYLNENNNISTKFIDIRKDFITKLFTFIIYKHAVEIKSKEGLFTSISKVNDKTHLFITNVSDLYALGKGPGNREGEIEIQFNSVEKENKVYGLSYLGEVKEINGKWSGGDFKCSVPEVKKGMVVWIE